MDNKKLGILLILICLLMAVIVFSFNSVLEDQMEAECSCGHEEGFCPHENANPWQIYLGVAVISGLGALGTYLLFFEKSQKEIVSSLKEHKNMKIEGEKFDILMKGLVEEEKKVMKAVKEQDGISQQTLRLRTDMHKSKLSIVLKELEGKGLIKRIDKGKTKQVFMKIKL